MKPPSGVEQALVAVGGPADEAEANSVSGVGEAQVRPGRDAGRPTGV